MVEKIPPNKDVASRPARRRRPIKMMIFTIAVAIGLFVMHWQSDLLNEKYNLDPSMPHLFTMLLTLITVLAWVIWTFFFAKLRLLALLILMMPIVFLTLFYPNFGGDANIKGWKPRYWKSDINYTELENKTSAGIDISSTTPHDFPQFLGKHRDGIVRGVELATQWDVERPRQLWKKAIGEGWSGFAAINGFAITQEQRGSIECVTCYEIKTGNLVWIHESNRRHEDISAMGKVGPRATPTIDQGRVYTTSGTGVLDCLDGATGKLLWTADVPQLVGITQQPHMNGLGLQYTMEDSRLTWGRAGSPLIYQDFVVVTAGGPDKDERNQTTTLLAFDKVSGKEVWRGGNRMVAYGSPSLATMLGKPQILLIAEDRAVGHDPETGVELWNHERLGKSSADANCSQVTYVSDSQLLLSKGYNMGGELIELSTPGDAIAVRSVHKDSRVLKTKLTSPVIKDGFAYSLSDGYLECTELTTFNRKWKQRGRFGNGQLLLVGDLLLVHTEDGQLLLIAADPSSYQELGAIDTIKGTCWNTICLYGNQLLVRSELEAACFELPVSNPVSVSSDSNE